MTRDGMVPGKDVQSVFDVIRLAFTSSKDDPPVDQKRSSRKQRDDKDRKRKR